MGMESFSTWSASATSEVKTPISRGPMNGLWGLAGTRTPVKSGLSGSGTGPAGLGPWWQPARVVSAAISRKRWGPRGVNVRLLPIERRQQRRRHVHVAGPQQSDLSDQLLLRVGEWVELRDLPAGADDAPVAKRVLARHLPGPERPTEAGLVQLGHVGADHGGAAERFDVPFADVHRGLAIAEELDDLGDILLKPVDVVLRLLGVEVVEVEGVGDVAPLGEIGVRAGLEALVPVLDEDHLVRRGLPDRAIEPVVDHENHGRVGAAHRLVHEIEGGDAGIAGKLLADAGPIALGLGDVLHVEPKAVPLLLAGVVLVALPAGEAVHVEDDVEAGGLAHRDGGVQPFEPARLVEDAVEEGQADVVEAGGLDLGEIGVGNPVVAPRIADAQHGGGAEAVLDRRPEGDVILHGPIARAGGRLFDPRGHPGLLDQPAAEVNAAQRDRFAGSGEVGALGADRGERLVGEDEGEEGDHGWIIRGKISVINGFMRYD